MKPEIINGKTVLFWSTRTGKVISPTVAKEMISNVSGFFQVLQEWDEIDRKKPGSAGEKKCLKYTRKSK